MPRVLVGDGSYGFKVFVENDDLVVRDVRATVFGGKFDTEDNGQTSSGVADNQVPWKTPLGCALPMSGAGSKRTEGSPIPKLPYLKTKVRVYSRESRVILTVPLIELGPAKPPRAHAAIDLTESTFAALKGNHKKGHIRVDYRILGGARHLPSRQAR